MPSWDRSGRRGFLAFALALSAISGWLVWKTVRDPGTPFLVDVSPAAWIVYPTPPSTRLQPAVALDTVFRRSFVLARRPAAARLAVRCDRFGAVWINGVRVVATPPDGDWKRARVVPVASYLQPGVNRIVARVVAATGPPAIWFSLVADGRHFESDRSWAASLAGASWRPARLAATPMSEWATANRASAVARERANPSPLLSARASLPLLVVFALLGAGLVALGRALLRRLARSGAGVEIDLRQAVALMAFVAVAWGALFWHDRRLDPRWGFDAAAHLDYVRHVLERGELPLADQGWEMYQPPLYYVVAAGVLRATGHSSVDVGAVLILRGLGWILGMVQCAALLAGLRLALPGRPRAVVAGFLLAAFVPVQLYMFLYVSNEGLFAALASVALALALRILARRDRSPPAHLLLGAVLGLAMLAKFSALVPLAVIAVVLTGRLTADRVREARIYLRSVGAMLASWLVVCGWHYARVVGRFGRPLVGNWDPATGFRWWLDPGVATVGQFLRFGRSLTAPLFSAFHSFADSLYSTFWGDGLVGGSALLAVRPPWNYGLMAAGYLLALVPSAALIIGLVAGIVRVARRPRAGDLLLLGVLGATGFAVVVMCLRLPFYAQAKAFYGLSAMVGIAFVGGWGWEWLAGGRGGEEGGREKPAEVGGAAAGGAQTRPPGRPPSHPGGSDSCAPSSPPPPPRPAFSLRLRSGVLSVALATWAVNAFATFWVIGGPGDVAAAAQRALDPGGLLARAERASAEGRDGEAAVLARAAIEIDPDHPFAWAQLGGSLARSGRMGEAIDALREALRVSPRDGAVHAELARAYALVGQAGWARYHAGCSRRLAVGIGRGG